MPRRRRRPSCDAFWLGVELVDTAARPAAQTMFAATVAPHLLALGSETPDNWRALRWLRYDSDGRTFALRGPSGEACAAMVRRHRDDLIRWSARELVDLDEAARARLVHRIADALDAATVHAYRRRRHRTARRAWPFLPRDLDGDDVHAVEASLPGRAERDLRTALRAAVILVDSGPPAPPWFHARGRSQLRE